MNILGIDPGYGRLGVAVITNAPNGRSTLVHATLIETPSTLSLAERLWMAQQILTDIVTTYTPRIAGVESLFMTKNTKTAIGVAEARGMILALLASQSIPIRDITPNQVKLALTGHGKADKAQVAHMVRRILTAPTDITQDDVMDAIAIAMTAERLWRP